METLLECLDMEAQAYFISGDIIRHIRQISCLETVKEDKK